MIFGDLKVIDVNKIVDFQDVDTIIDIIKMMVDADKQLAQIAIYQAISIDDDAEHVAKAQGEMTKASEDFGNGKCDKAIDHYKKAWAAAQKAIKNVEPDDGLCAGGVKPQVLRMEYIGGGEEALYHSQDPNKVSVVGDPYGAESVYIIATDKEDPYNHGAKIWFEGEVNICDDEDDECHLDEFDINATNAGESKLKSSTYVYIFADESRTLLLQTVKFHTSCSQPLNVFDQFGSIRFVELILEPQDTPTLSSSSDFAALSAYPQPCNPEVWIPYALGKDVKTTITIYDVTGRLVRVLNLGYQKAGFYVNKDRLLTGMVAMTGVNTYPAVFTSIL